MYRPCDPYTLCGISSRFQLLSPTERQVAHALLTRPPLRFKINRSFIQISVRLACVRHAASVRPEPGSNSLKNCILSLFRPKIIFKSSIWLSIITVRKVSFQTQNHFRVPCLLKWCCLIYKVLVTVLFSLALLHQGPCFVSGVAALTSA